ncbi:MAG: PspC domain-containing protein [Microscillaceae bacterium]|nr:PspC domain-containing protein [Microscillaceae bacterium]
MKKIQDFLEHQAFGVCTRLGEKMGLASSRIRIFFIYASFLTFGSPILLYLALAFLMNLRRYWRQHKSPSVWDL